ncbi:lytic transglycosylase domain-containing protein [bacterium]|nr:lytic transglycosylase domain-containing protein [bacterium]
MILIVYLFSILNLDQSFQKELLQSDFNKEILFQIENQNLSNIVNCPLAIFYYENNILDKAENALYKCRKLGGKKTEWSDFLLLKTLFYQNKSGLLSSIAKFQTKYSDSIFLEEVDKIKQRALFRMDKYTQFFDDKNLSLSQKRVLNYMKAYQNYKLSTKKFFPALILLEYDEFLSESLINELKTVQPENLLDELNENDVNSFYYRLSLLRRTNKEMFIESLNYFKKKYGDDKGILKKGDLRIHLIIQEYFSIAVDKKDELNIKESFLDSALKIEDLTEDEIFDILYQKALLYHKYKKNSKRIENYEKILELSILPKNKKSYYKFRKGVYQIEDGLIDSGLETLYTLIDEIPKWYPEYPKALWLIFKNEKSKEKKTEIIEKMRKIWSLKNSAHFYSPNSDSEKYFKDREDTLYSRFFLKDNLTSSPKKWGEYSKYQKITPSKKLDLSKNYIGNQLWKFLPESLEIEMVKEGFSIGIYPPVEDIIISLYLKFYKILYKEKEKNLTEEELELKSKIKPIKEKIFIQFLNYFITTENYYYIYLILNRHFQYFRKDDKSIYYKMFHPLAYFEAVDKYSKEFDVNPFLVLSIMETESIFHPEVVSSAGAIGLMQIMPQTGKKIAESLNVESYDLFNPDDNIRFGVYYISQLLKRFKNQIPFSSASYNGGPHNMSIWLKKHKDEKLSLIEMIDQIEFSESRNYAHKIVRLLSTYSKLYLDQKITIPMEVDYEETKSISY